MTGNAVHDALLEADAWKQTASRWRKRALREGAPWRRKCRELEAELDTANERGAELAEEVDGLKSKLDTATRPLRLENEKLSAELLKAQKARQLFEDEVARFKRKMGTAGSMEALVVERDGLKEQLAEQKSRVDQANSDSRSAYSRAHKAEQEAADARERYAREQVMPAKARIRVLATRLGIAPDWPGYSDDEKLTAELDRRIASLMQKPG